MSGWIKIHRKITACPYWLDEPFTRGQAWVDMLLLANHKHGYIRVQGMRVDIMRGELGFSEVSLSERWKWSRGKVRRFLDELIKDGMIDKKTHEKQDRRKNIITVLNYDKYQSENTSDDTSDDTSDGQAAGQATVQEQEEVKNVKNKRIKECVQNDEKFDQFWASYPKKIARKNAMQAWKKMNCGNGKFETILESLEKQKSSEAWTKEGGKYIPLPTTWINGERWEDKLEVAIHGKSFGIRCHQCENEKNPACINRTEDAKIKCQYFREAVVA